MVEGSLGRPQESDAPACMHMGQGARMVCAWHAHGTHSTQSQRAHSSVHTVVCAQCAHMHMHGTGREEEHVVEIMPDRGARLVQRGHRREMALDGEIPDETHHAACLARRVWAGCGRSVSRSVSTWSFSQSVNR